MEWRIDARVKDNLSHSAVRSTTTIHRHQLTQLVACTVRRAHRRERTAIVRIIAEWMHVQCQFLVNSSGVRYKEELQSEPEQKSAHLLLWRGLDRGASAAT